MRALLIVANALMGVRETYTTTLRRDFPGWGVSHMSGLPPDPGSIVRGYDVIVYELFPPDDPRRYKAALALWNDIKEFGDVRIVTHLDGPYRDGMVADLTAQGVVVIAQPFGAETIADAFRAAVPARPVSTERRRGLSALFRHQKPEAS